MANKRLFLRLLGLKEGEQVNVSLRFFTRGELEPGTHCNIQFFIFLCTRYKKRERGKLVHAYSSQDLEGILVSLLLHDNCVSTIWILIRDITSSPAIYP